MCSPTAVILVASTLMSAQSQAQQSEYQQDVGQYEKGVAEYNARVSENEAQEIRAAGVESENLKRTETAQLLAKQRAQLGASGVQVGSGSAFQLQEDTVTLGEADALRIRSNYEAEAEAKETGAVLTRSQGELAESKGDFAKTTSDAKVTGTLLSGASAVAGTGVADKWFTPDSSATAIDDWSGFERGL